MAEQPAQAPSKLRAVGRHLGRYAAVLTSFGVAVAAGFGAALVLPASTWESVQAVLKEVVGIEPVNGETLKNTAKVLGNIGLGGAGATLIAALRPRFQDLGTSIVRYLEGGGYRQHVLKPALIVFAVAVGASLSLIAVKQAAATTSGETPGAEKPTITIDRGLARRLARAAERPLGLTQLQVTANTAIPIKFEASDAPDGDAIRVAIEGDPSPTKEIQSLREALVNLTNSLKDSGTGSTSLTKLDAIDKKLRNIETHVAGLAPRGIEMVR
jgi:hypothetical protein